MLKEIRCDDCLRFNVYMQILFDASRLNEYILFENILKKNECTTATLKRFQNRTHVFDSQICFIELDDFKSYFYQNSNF